MTRTGMATLITRWRRMVSDAGSAVWTDDQALTLLDTYRTDIWAGQLMPIPQQVSGTTVYQTFASNWENLEDASGGTPVFRMHDANGSAIGTATFTGDYQRGVFTFTADQKGSVRYIDARSYDLNAAAADGWRELMGAKSSLYKFTADGATYERNQWFDHCKDMARYYDSLSKPTYTTLERSDLAGWERSDLD